MKMTIKILQSLIEMQRHVTASENQESDDDAPNDLVQVTTQDPRKCLEAF